MLSVDDIVSDVLRREGGYVNDPDDPGGATNYGITLGTLQRLGIDVDGDGFVDKSDVRTLSKSEAAKIFKEHYYIRTRISNLPTALQPSVFDMYVNSGSAAVTILQKLFSEFGFPVAVDGILGSKTIAAAVNAINRAPGHLVDAYGIARRNYYYDIADKRVNSRKYARRNNGGKGGWIKRAEEFISPRFHLTNIQHNQRVAGWG